ncbi:MAG: hypothetical protein DRP57_12205 [Spirochaetes bacterium]|nr:MAG: hypothetical protein DRP57_12205 [Spirochaetota bacterium]
MILCALDAKAVQAELAQMIIVYALILAGMAVAIFALSQNQIMEFAQMVRAALLLATAVQAPIAREVPAHPLVTVAQGATVVMETAREKFQDMNAMVQEVAINIIIIVTITAVQELLVPVVLAAVPIHAIQLGNVVHQGTIIIQEVEGNTNAKDIVMVPGIAITPVIAQIVVLTPVLILAVVGLQKIL